MKKFRTILCAAGLTLLMSVTALAAKPVEGIAIHLNGQPMTFTDAVPQIVNDRTYLPFRTVFTALGFADENITYDDVTKTVSAASQELTVSMVIGENRVSVTKNGKTQVLETDVPAFIDTRVSRTFVPARFVAEAAEYRVGWNDQTHTVIIDDVDAILAQNQETYDILDRYLDFSRPFQTKNCLLQGDYRSHTLDGVDSTSLTGPFELVVSPAGRFEFLLSGRMEGTLNGVDLLAALPGGLNMELRGDLSTNVVYSKSDLTGDQWTLLAQDQWTGGDRYSAILTPSQGRTGKLSGKHYVEAYMKQLAQEDMSVSVADTLNLFNALWGDSAFSKRGSAQISSLYMDGVNLEVTVNGTKGYSAELSSETMWTRTAVVKDEVTIETVRVNEEGRDTTTLTGHYATTSRKPAELPE